MKKSDHPKRIILAVDVKAEDPKLTERIWNALKPLLRNGEAVIEPVTILNREDAAMGNYFKSRIGRLRTATERHLGDQLSELGLKGLAAPKVLFADGSSTQRAVMALLSHAKKAECDLIAISSHARKGLKRFFLGSFAETLSLQSSVPLLVVNSHQRVRPEILRTILFPTDFSPVSKEGLEIVCNSFRDKKSKIILFHSYTFPIQLYMEPFGSLPLPQSEIEKEFQKTEKVGKTWCKELRNRGIACELVIDRKSRIVTKGILSTAKQKKAGLIAMVSTTGKWGTRLLGSVTRQVLRESLHPVWVVHPTHKVAKNKVLKISRRQ